MPQRAIHGDWIELAGGPGAIVDRARSRFEAGDSSHAVHLLDVVLSQPKPDPAGLELAIEVHRKLESESVNFWLTEWLRKQIDLLEKRLGES